ncbi:hypothetical protein SAMN05421813_11043 [Daejeonella rubra]|uniref:Uncharacterized protein n=1 Tax=Daejeonella rubra TaxID=990371 RepID=A0A1G9SG51_9SPHI|nr:hypothetical protein SAMN05421813_11043 [Daejeonella rubra]
MKGRIKIINKQNSYIVLKNSYTQKSLPDISGRLFKDISI